MILQSQPTDAWKPVDFALLEALQLIEQETCNECGNPIWHCDSDDRDLNMVVRNRTCAGSRAIRVAQNKNIKDRKERESDNKGRSDWGVQYFAVAELNPQAEREDLPTRTEYYESKADKT